jgi:uncharacterized membrane protein
MILKIAMVAAVVLSSAVVAEAQSWQICNRLTEDRVVSIAYVNLGSSGGFISEGWWTVKACGGCAKVLLRKETSDPHNVFLRAKDSRGNVVMDGGSRMCSASFKHTIVGNDSCKRRGFEDAMYRHVTVDLNKNYTTNLTGEPRCRTID